MRTDVQTSGNLTITSGPVLGKWTVSEAADWLDLNGVDCNHPKVSRALSALAEAHRRQA